MKYLNKKYITCACLSLLVLLQNSYANYDVRGMARFSLGIESGISSDKTSLNYKSDTLVEIDGLEYSSLFEESWDDMALWKNKLSFNIPLFKIGYGDLILQGFGAYGDDFSGKYKLTERYDPVDKEAAGHEYLYRNYSFGEVDFKSYDFSVNLAYQIPITPDGRKNRDYYIFNSKVHSFLLPKIGYSQFRQDHAVSGSFNFGTLENYTDNYSSNWGGPFIGLDTVNYISDNHKILFGGNLYYINYNISADLGSEGAALNSLGVTDSSFDSFFLRSNNSVEGDATGSGYSLDLRYSYQPGNHVSYDINANYTSTRIKGGDTKYHYRDGTSEKNKINEAGWESFLLSVGITYNF